MQRCSSLSRGLFCALALFATAGSAQASSVLLYEVSGLVTQGNGVSINVDDAWSARLYANNPSSDRDAGTNGLYRIDWTGEVLLGDEQFAVFSLMPTSGLSITLGNPSVPTLSLGVPFNNIVVIDGGAQVQGFSVGLWDSTTQPSLTDDTLLGTQNFSNSDEVFGQAIFGLTGGNGVAQIVGDVRQAKISVVPIPAASWLFASALGVFGYLGKRKSTAV